MQDDIISRLQDLVLQADNAQEFFQELAVFPASLLAPAGGEVHCNVTVARRKRLEGDSSAALNIYSSAVHGFSPVDIARAELFGEQSAKTLRFELRLAQLRDAKEDLEAAMKSRTAIDIAVGVIVAQNRCSQAAAMAILRTVSSSRNVELREVAAGIVESVSKDRPAYAFRRVAA
jgi:hypothetical protein